MEPILISSLKKLVQNVILQDQDKLNPNHNAYIEEDEIGELLRHFGAKDISELQETGLDTFEAEKTDETAEAKPAEIEVEKENPEIETTKTEQDKKTEDSQEKEKTAAKGIDMVKRDSARTELITSDSADVGLASPDNPLSTIHESASEELRDFVENVAGEMQKIQDDINNSQMTEEKIIKYKDAQGNEKTIDIRQAVSLGGIMKKEPTPEEDDAPDETDNTLIGGIHYSLLANTDNSKLGFNAHIDNDDQDFFAYVMHDKTLNNNGKLGFTGSARVTLDKNKFETSGGGAVDYENGNVSAGAYGHFDFESTTEGNTLEYEAKAYVNYKDVGGFYAGVDGMHKGEIVPYAGGNLYGSKVFDNGLSISGAISTELQYMRIDPQGAEPEIKLLSNNTMARGNLTFKAGDDMSAGLDAMVVYRGLFLLGDNSKPIQDLGAVLRGNFRKGKTEVYTTGCFYKQFATDNPLITGAATFGIQINDLVKPGIAAYVEGTVCNTKDNTNPNSAVNGIKVGSRLNF